MSHNEMIFHGKSLIGGKAQGDGRSFTAFDPITGQALPGAFHEADSALVDAAAHQAADAFAAGLSRERRISLLEGIAEAIEGIGQALLARTQAETALPRARLISERKRTINQLRMFAQLLRDGEADGVRVASALPDRKPLPRPDLRSHLVGVGPVVVFGASNFPLAYSVAGGDTAAALAAGCPVLFKAHPAHPGCCELVAQAICETVAKQDLHPGWFSMLHGQGHQVGEDLIRHPMVKAGGFTGSLAGGRALFDLACQRPEPIPFHAEMGSANPVFILPGLEDPVALGNALASSICLGVGQFCVNPGILLSIRGQDDVFRHTLQAAMEQQPAGTMLHRGIADHYQQACASLDAHAKVSLLCRGHAGTTACPGQAAVYQMLAKDFLAEPSLWDERFGPVSLLVRCANETEMLAVARSMPGSLTATIHGPEGDLARHFASILVHRVGRLLWGGVPTGVEVCSAIMHGGPYPATTETRFTSVGTTSIRRFLRRVCYQGFPDSLLPPGLRY